LLGIAAVTVVAGIYNLLTIPRGDGEGIFATIRRAQEAFEWSVSASTVNSLVFILMAGALAILALKADFEG